MWSATGNAAARAPSLSEIRRNSQGSRRDSTASQPRSQAFSPSTPEFPSSPTRTRPERARTGSSGKLERITGEDKDEDSLDNFFGRGELNDQSFVRGRRASQVSTRVPKLAVRGRNDKQKEAEDTMAKTMQSSTVGSSTEGKARNETGKEGDQEEIFYDLDDDLDDLMRKPKRSSKNIDAMLGRTPVADSTGYGASGAAKGKEVVEGNKLGERREPFPKLEDEDDGLDDLFPKPKRSSKNIDAMLGRTPAGTPQPPPVREEDTDDEPVKPEPNEEGVYPNGYSFPAKKTWAEATAIGFKAFLRFIFTPLGFFIVLYGLNVVAWGGMLFLLLCNASPWMCQLGDGRYDCNDINSPRRVWVEIDSQILNSLFCVTGFGLIPWRFRDFYYYLKWRIWKQEPALRKLAGYHNGWFRLPGSDRLPIKSYSESQQYEDETNPALPIPLRRTPAPPLTGARAPPTPLWKMDYVVWAFVWNTFLQAVLSAFMWGLNRYDRPSWSTGLFVALACIVAAMGGLMQFFEGKKIKKVEGIPLDTEKTVQDVEKEQQKKKGSSAISSQKSEERDGEVGAGHHQAEKAEGNADIA